MASGPLRPPGRWDFELLQKAESAPSAACCFVKAVDEDMHTLMAQGLLDPAMHPSLLYQRIMQSIENHTEHIREKKSEGRKSLNHARQGLLRELGNVLADATISFKASSDLASQLGTRVLT